MTTAKQFLDTIFDNLDEDEHVCVSRATPKKDGDGVWFKNYLLTARQWRKWDADKQAQAWYFCVSTINGELNAKGTMVGRGRANLRRYYCLVLDDIGTKADEPPIEPSWKLESSVGNWQWGYLLDPGSDWNRYEALVEYCHTKGWGDAGAGGSYRLMRVPGSANLKPGRQNFRSVITHFETDVWSLDELAEDLGCDFNKIEVRDVEVKENTGGHQAMEGIDPMLDWLSDAGHIVRDDGSEWVEIVCPWSDAHTTGTTSAGYSPLGRGGGAYVQTRAFNCLHEHCQKKKLSEFREWAMSFGAPYVSGHDPLPWLQAKYVFIETGQQVADLDQRPLGGIWLWEFSDWKLKHPGRVTPPGRDNPVAVATAFIEDDKTKKAVSTKYTPVSPHKDDGMTSAFKQTYVNTYVPPNWAETSDEPEIFLEHMKYLIPKANECEVFLDWLAYKIQHPGVRSYATVMVAEDSFGIGRSWIKDMLMAVLQGHVNTVSLAQLIGKGTSAEQTYNDWMAGCQFLVVEEAKDSGLTRDDFYHGYETFKQMVDTKVNQNVRINPKFGRTRMEDVYFNALILSNHADAMALPDGDRRVFVVENPTKRRDYEYYDVLTSSLKNGEPARVYWWLMHRDVSSFDHVYPPMTQAKSLMIESTRAPSDAIFDHILENHAPDLVTKVTLRKAVMSAAREFDMDKIMREPAGVARMIWRKIKSLRPEDVKNGARYMVDGKQTEVRAIRQKALWKDNDVARDKTLFEDELNKTEVAVNVVNIRG
jgi:hypothetical protein